MKVVNLATVAVDATAGGTIIFSEAQARIATTEGMESIFINPSAEVVLVDSDGLNPSSQIPNLAGTGNGAVPGTVANSPLTCPANTVSEIAHRSGPVRVIGSGATTVKIAVGEAS